MADRYPNPSTINFSNGWEEVPTYLNEVTKGLFGTMLIIAIYVITLMGVLFYKRDEDAIKESIMIAGVFTSMVAILFWIGNVISGWTLTFTLVVGIAGFIIWNMNR